MGWLLSGEGEPKEAFFLGTAQSKIGCVALR
jgi:hypothetical protein